MVTGHHIKNRSVWQWPLMKPNGKKGFMQQTPKVWDEIFVIGGDSRSAKHKLNRKLHKGIG